MLGKKRVVSDRRGEAVQHLLDFDRADLIKGIQPVTAGLDFFEPRSACQHVLPVTRIWHALTSHRAK
jgi:hypothetical protein